ncbi:tRNA (adenosine(37)-N6)-threonylcarbamoyltransferase complex dimerization subunit type 1 TsaB [Roseomonas sp. CCTCC AB2023176]|uniref:tRNA (adenosine(37)-N6)-threonylcarbamoyltransferase complex dimerization subunit type 1 TsaB n=1 Tax=Roseomonas sp. CCTCC AB2023176 TaxID=3342640 RepID=UPI0035D68D60
MVILGLDAALARASAALWRDGAVVTERRRDAQRGQPAVLPALAAEVLEAAGHPVPDVVAVAIGPGGFTGLRAAIALAEGFALGWGVPLLGVTTGEALAAALTEAELEGREAWSVTTAGRGGLVLERPGEAPVLVEEARLPMPAGPVVLVGDAAPVAAARLLARGRGRGCPARGCRWRVSWRLRLPGGARRGCRTAWRRRSMRNRST